MSYSVKSIALFEKQAKRLSKKYPSLKNELWELTQNLKENPEQGTPIGKNCFKVRLSVRSKGKGKSGGTRVITHVVVAHKLVYLLSIYDKSEMESISGKELLELLQFIP